VLDRVALTGSPSNKEATVFIARSIPKTPEVKVADPVVDEAVARQISEAVATAKAEFEATQRAKDERIAALEADKAARDEDISRSQCNDTASVFRNIGADGVKLGDLIFRTRKAAKAAGDTALETDMIAILRAADARAKAGGTVALTENRGAGGGDTEGVERALDKFSPVTRAAVQKHLKDGATFMSAMRSASKEAIADGKDMIYTEISNALNGKG
jgi:hypothetical protein